MHNYKNTNQFSSINPNEIQVEITAIWIPFIERNRLFEILVLFKSRLYGYAGPMFRPLMLP